MTEQVPKSPCISVCVLNEEDVCIGCYRSANEITDWFMATPGQKREILARARERQAAANPVRLS
ncbi:DUF1289 domain-containing protein [Haliea sp. E17]|uniref:DUF1289 domain-containing protein n=1 Tax=Haliea sp. E17 TaxID=3401576 RepID=UPI003AAD5BBC